MAEDARADDTTIPNTDRLFRRVRENQLVKLEDGSRRPSSALFKDTKMSVNIESLMVQQGRPPEDTLTRYPGEYLTSIIAGDVRDHGLRIVKQTEPPHDPAHGLVLGKKKGSFANAMVRSHQWIVPPPRE
ncbi:MAG: hypothetical protein ACREXK_07895 [Gammaproteobacteria bacterium]